MDVTRAQRLAFVSASLATSAAVSLAGPIGFIGIVVPHLVRLMVGVDHRIVLPASALFGAAFLVACDLARAHADGAGRDSGRRRHRDGRRTVLLMAARPQGLIRGSWLAAGLAAIVAAGVFADAASDRPATAARLASRHVQKDVPYERAQNRHVQKEVPYERVQNRPVQKDVPHEAQAAAARRASARRIVSLVPALTEMLFAVGAGPQVVAVSSYDEFPPEVKALPQVGALLDPDTERILALRPGPGDRLRLAVGRSRRSSSGPASAPSATATAASTPCSRRCGELGAATGHAAEAARVVADAAAAGSRPCARAWRSGRGRASCSCSSASRDAARDLRQRRQRLPARDAGGRRRAERLRRRARESVQPSQETLLTRAPDVILEVRAAGLLEQGEVARERGVWSALPGLPAVRNQRVHLLSGGYLLVPGPRLADATEAFARALHPDAFPAAR